MSRVVRLHEWQGSPEWHSYRAAMGNASEAAALMDCAPWFPHTPYELWLLKTGRAQRQETPAMGRGRALEPKARTFIESRFDEVYEPQVMALERISASLDGLSFDGRRALEIKCPTLGRDSELWREVERGAPPAHYWWQAQQILLCSGAETLRFVVCHGEAGEITDLVHCQVAPDPLAHELIQETWNTFFQHLDADQPPPLGERDVARRDDAAWRDACAAWKDARAWLEEARRAEAETRRALIEAAEGRSTQGAGLKLTRHWRRGDVDWRRACQGMDLEPFRKDGGWQYRITEQE